MKTKKITLCAILSAVAIVFGYIEYLFPIPVAIPGVKWGFGNIIVLITLFMLGRRYSFFVMMIKVIVSSLLFASPSVLIYSLCGGVLSLFVMIILKKLKLDIINVSIGGGISHNVGQLAAAAIMMKTSTVFSYLPFLIISGIVTGVVTGVLSKIILKRIKTPLL